MLPLTSGNLQWKGAAMAGLRPHQIAGLGIIKTFQNPQLFLDLTVFDNVAVAGHLVLKRHLGWGRLWGLIGRQQAEDVKLAKMVDDVLQLCRLESVRDQKAASLSYGQEKMLGVAMAMMCEPELLLLDEPASGLGDEEIRDLEGVLKDLRADGVTLCIIDHKVGFLSKLCDRALALMHGNLIAEGPPAKVLEHPEVIGAYLGRKHA